MSRIVLESVIFFLEIKRKNKSFSGLEGRDFFDFLDFLAFLDFFGLFKAEVEAFKLEAFKDWLKILASGNTLLAVLAWKKDNP